MIGVPLPDTAVFDATETLLRRLDHMHRLLADADLTSVRIVLNLERVAIAEAERSFTYFHLYGYPTDLVISNRIIPADAGAYFDTWRELQNKYLPGVADAFAPVPVKPVPYFDREIVGLERLRELGHALYGDEDPTQHYYRGRPYSVKRDAESYVLTLELPFTSRENVELSRHGDELVLQVGSWRRNLLLPRALIEAPTQGARMDDGKLQESDSPFPRAASQEGPAMEPDAGNEMDERVAQLEGRLRELETRRVDSARTLLGRVVPPEVRRHFMNGQREQLLAARALVDFWIAKLDARDRTRDESASKGREDIPIE